MSRVKSWLAAAGRWAWLAISALAVLWAVGRVRRAQRAAEAAEERYRDIYDQAQAEDGEQVLEAIRGHNEAQARAKEAKRDAEAKIDKLASGDEDLADLLDRYNRDHEAQRPIPTIARRALLNRRRTADECVKTTTKRRAGGCEWLSIDFLSQ